jgi:hypothetical protein
MGRITWIRARGRHCTEETLSYFARRVDFSNECIYFGHLSSFFGCSSPLTRPSACVPPRIPHRVRHPCPFSVPPRCDSRWSKPRSFLFTFWRFYAILEPNGAMTALPSSGETRSLGTCPVSSRRNIRRVRLVQQIPFPEKYKELTCAWCALGWPRYEYPSDYGASQKGDRWGRTRAPGEWWSWVPGCTRRGGRREGWSFWDSIEVLAFDEGEDEEEEGEFAAGRVVYCFEGGGRKERSASLCLGSSVCVLRGWSLFGYLSKGTSQQEFLHVDIAVNSRIGRFFFFFFFSSLRVDIYYLVVHGNKC